MNVQRNAPSETLRAAIVTDGRPQRQIAKAANLSASTVNRFVNRRRSLPLDSFDRVAAVIGWELRPAARPR